MGRNADALSEKQVATLEWIRDGCAGVDGETEVSRKISAASLHGRGLATVKGAGATWKASITPAGRAWLEAHPTTVAEAVGGPDGLFACVLAANGHLAIGGDAEAKAAHEELVRLSHHAASRPRGWRLEVKNAGSWAEPAYEAALVRHFEDLVEERPVPVPERVTRYHPSVKAYLDDRDRQMVGREHVARAGRILQAIADEAPRRGVGATDSTSRASTTLTSIPVSRTVSPIDAAISAVLPCFDDTAISSFMAVLLSPTRPARGQARAPGLPWSSATRRCRTSGTAPQA